MSCTLQGPLDTSELRLFHLLPSAHLPPPIAQIDMTGGLDKRFGLTEVRSNTQTQTQTTKHKADVRKTPLAQSYPVGMMPWMWV